MRRSTVEQRCSTEGCSNTPTITRKIRTMYGPEYRVKLCDECREKDDTARARAAQIVNVATKLLTPKGKR